ncbi:MAG: LLM class flavin-dependent oxidoreductase [Acidimicrobiales bacterium]
MRSGVILPTFRDDTATALDVARRAEVAGIDGVFCYDHLWPMGRPDRPALAPFPVLAAIAMSTERLAVGTLVARVGLVPDEVLLAEVDALSTLAPGRVVIAMGTGDRLSAAENRAYGVPFTPAAERRDTLCRVARAVRDRGVPVWIGAGSPATNAVAEDLDVAVNLWDAAPRQVAAQGLRTEVTWAGPAPEGASGGSAASDETSTGAAAVISLIPQLADAGATWAVYGWPVPMEVLARTVGELPGGK